MSKENKFNFIMPAEISKSEDGEWKIAGLASTQDIDRQGESIIQKGVDLSPIDAKRGYFNFDHLSGPENLIGTIDGYNQSPKGLYVHGKLFKNHSRAKAVYEIMSSLGKGEVGRVGMSVEGKILKRSDANPNVIEKCRIDKVAITLNPVNTNTYADLVKSMSGSSIEFNATEDNYKAEETEELLFSASQVVSMVQKALTAGAPGMKAPAERTGGEALATQDTDSDKDEEKEEKACTLEPKKLKKMTKSLYKSAMLEVLDQLQALYPDSTRSELWESVKERLDTKYPKVFKALRIKNTSAKEREHKLYEEARQRGDYEENKDKSRQQLAEIARDSGVEAKEKAKIRAQADAAAQVGDKDHVRPGVKG